MARGRVTRQLIFGEDRLGKIRKTEESILVAASALTSFERATTSRGTS